jgi:hypothetical protein
MLLFHFFQFNFTNVLIGILVKGSIITVLFLIPIYFLKWEMELNTYVSKVIGILKRK